LSEIKLTTTKQEAAIRTNGQDTDGFRMTGECLKKSKLDKENNVS
jgi:hypothetical protein